MVMPVGYAFSTTHTTPAEQLLELARFIKCPKQALVLATSLVGLDRDVGSRVTLALKLDRLPAITKFLAVAEGWSLERIVQEVY